MTRRAPARNKRPAGRREHYLLALLAMALLALAPSVAAGASTRPAAGPETFLPVMEEFGPAPGWNLRMGMLATDNVNRVSDSEEAVDELVGVGEFGANWRYVGTRFAMAVDGTIAYRHYTQNDFDDEARANFMLAGDWFILPDTLDWFVTDRIANAPINPLGTTSPTNVQFVNVLETGPRLTLRPGNANELTIGVAGASVNAEETPIDHERKTGSLAFFRDLSSYSSLGIEATASEVDFQPEAVAEDFEQESAHLEYRRRSDTMNLSVAGGSSRTELATGLVGDSATGWIRLGMRRTSDSSVYFSAERRASDTATAMLRNELLFDPGSSSSFIVTGDPLFADSATLRYTRGWRAHQWSASLFARELDYFVTPLDQKQKGVRLGMNFRFSSRLALLTNAAFSDVEYLNIDRSDTFRLLRAEADYRIDRAWSLVSGLRFLKRESTDMSYSFDELMLTLFLSYSPQGRDPARE